MSMRSTGVVVGAWLLVVAVLAGQHLSAERVSPRIAGPPARGAAGVGASTTVHTTAAAARRPNVVLVMADDMRVDELRFAPHVRRLVGRHGLRFQNSFAPYPLCCPARASFLSGQYAHNHEVYWHDEPYGYGAFDDSLTIATSLRAAGYRTGFIGKYLNGYGPDLSKVSGRPSYRYVPRGWSDWRASFENPGVPGIHGGTYDYLDTPFNVNGRVDNRYRGRYQTRVLGDFSVAMAARFARGPAPFFMYVNYVAPHFGAPHERDDPSPLLDSRGQEQVFPTPARPEWVRGRFDRLVDRGAGMPRGGGPSEAHIGDKPKAFRSNPEPLPAERTALRDVTRQRAESIFVMDREVQRLVARLKKAGEWKDTVFMFTSDNGYFLGEHRRREGKVRAHEPSLRVPFLVTGPGMRGGERRYDPITTVDLSATILDLAHARPPHPADGVSRVATMRRGDRGWTVPVLMEAIHTGGRTRGARGFDDVRTSIGVRTPRYSYIKNRTGEHELYDLLRDPRENRNVFAQPTYREIRLVLDRVWTRLRHCQGRACREELPAALRATPGGTRSLTRHYWKVIDRVYGW